MAYPLLGTPKPQFFDSSGSPLVSGTLTIQDPDTSSAKATYPTAADADAQTNGTTVAITLDSRGEPSSTQLWGRDGEDYKVIVKDSSGSTIYTLDEIRLPRGFSLAKIQNADITLGTTTLADNSYLKDYVLDTNTWYKITGYLLATAAGATQDLKIAFAVSQTLQNSSYTYVAVDAATAGTVDAGEVQAITAATTIDIDSTSDVGIMISGFILTHATSATNLDLQVAQGTDSGTTTLKKGSWLKLEPIVTTAAS